MNARKTVPERAAAGRAGVGIADVEIASTDIADFGIVDVNIDLTVQTAVNASGLPRKTALRRWLAAALERNASITVRFVGAVEGRKLNRTYRGLDYATNVLSFGYGDDATDGALAGDLVLCTPVLRREARAQGKTLRAHLAHLIVHGALHLQGHDHQSPRAAARMEALEAKILAKLGYPDPYAN